jgi:hypothetical protein
MSGKEAEYSTPEKLVDRFDGLKLKTLANLRSQGRGPRFYRRGRRIFYKIEDVRRWITQNEVKTIDQA